MRGKQLDWVQSQVAQQKRLANLRQVIADELGREKELPFSETSIRVSLIMIRRNHGEMDYQETLRIFGLAELDAA